MILTTYLTILAMCSYSVVASTIRYDDNTKIKEDALLQEDYTKEDFESAVIKDLEISTDNNAYWLFTRQNPIVPQIIVHGDSESLRTSNYDSSKPLKVVTHGWTGHGNFPVNIMVTSAFLEIADVNVIVLDWSIDAGDDYFRGSIRVPRVGRSLGNFLQWVINTSGGDWETVHLIGYSLGAHVVGNAGRQVGGRPKRVTGLDPAGPFWSENSYALNTLSGQYVEAMHTNILSRGITEPIAHVDFYPNGGRMQPGCDSDHCSHDRAYELFASSIRTDHFVGRKCASFWFAVINQCFGTTLNMGNGVLNKSGDGIYALTTGSSWPF